LDIEDLRKKERVIDLDLTFVKFFASQDKETSREQKVSLGFAYRGKRKRLKKTITDEAEKPTVEEEEEKLVERFETAKVFSFPLTEEGYITLDDQVYGRWGVIHKAFFEIWRAMRKAPYVIEMLNLMRVENPNSDLLKVKPKNKFSDNEPEKPFSLPVPRSRGATRQIEYFDFIENRKNIPVRVVMPSELPISAEEFKTLVHGLEFMMLHPLRRGIVKVNSISAIQNGWQNTEKA